MRTRNTQKRCRMDSERMRQRAVLYSEWPNEFRDDTRTGLRKVTQNGDEPRLRNTHTRFSMQEQHSGGTRKHVPFSERTHRMNANRSTHMKHSDPGSACRNSTPNERTRTKRAPSQQLDAAFTSNTQNRFSRQDLASERGCISHDASP
jgi:hypothetical protein